MFFICHIHNIKTIAVTPPPHHAMYYLCIMSLIKNDTFQVMQKERKTERSIYARVQYNIIQCRHMVEYNMKHIIWCKTNCMYVYYSLYKHVPQAAHFTFETSACLPGSEQDFTQMIIISNKLWSKTNTK